MNDALWIVLAFGFVLVCVLIGAAVTDLLKPIDFSEDYDDGEDYG